MIRKLVLLWLVGLASATAQAARPTTQVASDFIQVKISPDITLLRPLKDSATITVEVGGSPGDPADLVDLSLRLTAPPPGALLSTDFPLIEGTPLIDMAFSGVPGTLSWDYVFPIRGVYRLDVAAADAEGRRWHRTFELRLRENPAKTAFLIGFAVALLILGFIAGRLFSSPATGVGVLMIALLIGAGAGANTNAVLPDGDVPQSTLAITPARVGTMSVIRWRVADSETGKPIPAEVALRVVQREKGREIFRLNRQPTDGELDLSFQFTDASPHEVTATGFTRNQKRRTEKTTTVHVDSAVPSFGIRVRPVLLFMLVVTAGLTAGRFSKKRRTPLLWTAKRVKMDSKETS